MRLTNIKIDCLLAYLLTYLLTHSVNTYQNIPFHLTSNRCQEENQLNFIGQPQTLPDIETNDNKFSLSVFVNKRLRL